MQLKFLKENISNALMNLERFEVCEIRKEGCTGEGCNYCWRFDSFYWAMKQSLIPNKLQKPIVLTAPDVDLIAYQKLAGIRDEVEEFIDAGKNLYLYSDGLCGNGKTSWALKLLMNYLVYAENYKLECLGLFISVPMFMIEAKLYMTSKDQRFYEIFEAIKEVPVVIWDEIGACDPTNMDYLMLLSLIDYRNLAQKSNIYTTNLTPEKLKTKFDERLYSRICDNSTHIELKGCGRRGQ